jgi:diacylglycerol kinase family enzyme
MSLPEFGILKLGTGNSLAPILGVKKGLKPMQLLAEGEDFDTRRMHFIEFEDRCFMFCGLGWDAEILNDYFWLKQRFRNNLLARFTRSVFGYLAALAFRTVPKVLFSRRNVTVSVQNLGERVYQIGRDGKLAQLKCSAGEVFYEGPCNAIGASTTPYYGYRVKAFPDALKLPGFMQVRVVKAGVAELLSHAPSVWRGTYRSPNFVDYLAENVHVSFSDRMPLQIGGDAEGYRDEISLRVSETTVDFLDFGRPLLHAS